MPDTAVAAASPAKPKKVAKKPVAKKPMEHPKYGDMVTTAVKALKERKGSSRQAISKYIKENFKVKDNAPTHIKAALKRLVGNGTLKQVKGTGASGSFKVAEKPKGTKKVKKTKVKRTTAKKAPKKAAKKVKAAKKTKKKVVKKPAAVAKKPVAKKPAAKKATKKPVAKKAAGGKKKAAKKAAKK